MFFSHVYVITRGKSVITSPIPDAFPSAEIGHRPFEREKRWDGCVALGYFRRFYTIDGVELGEPPRELTKVVKCVKYYSYWEFDTRKNYGKATKRFFDSYGKDLQKLLISPFDINLGYAL